MFFVFIHLHGTSKTHLSRTMNETKLLPEINKPVWNMCACKTAAKTEMEETRWKRIHIEKNQLSICFDTLKSNCNTDEQAADKQAGLAVVVAITLKFITENMYHFLFVPFPTCNTIYEKKKELQCFVKYYFLKKNKSSTFLH